MKLWDKQHSSSKPASAFVCPWLSLSAASLSLSPNFSEIRASPKCATICQVWVSNSYPSTKKAIFSLVRLKSWTRNKLKSRQTVKFCSIFRNLKRVPIILYSGVSFKVKVRGNCVSTKASRRIRPSQRRNTETSKPNSYFLKTTAISVKSLTLQKASSLLINAIKTKLPWWNFRKTRHSGLFSTNWWLHWSTCCLQWIWCSLEPTMLRLRLLLSLGSPNGTTRCNWWLLSTKFCFSFSHSSFVSHLASTLL